MATTTAHPIEFSSPLDNSSLKGRSVLVTGGAAGIGLACATELAAAGANVTISDLQRDAGQVVAESMLARGYNVQFVPCDVTSYAQQVDMFQKAISFGGGKLDIVIPNAGVMAEQNVFDMIPSQAPTLDSPPPMEPTGTGLNVNLRAVYNSCHLALHYFRLPRETGDTFKPTIIFIASLAGYVGYPSSSTYSMSKFGVRGLFYSIRDRAAQASVRINLVAPWYIETAMTSTADFLNSESGALAKMTGYAPMERVVDAVMRFSSDQNLNGRAAGIFLSGNEDLVDDLEGAYSGDILRKHMGEAMKMVMEHMKSAAEANDLARTDSAQV